TCALPILEIIVMDAAEVREGDGRDLVVGVDQGQTRLNLMAAAILEFEIPLAGVAALLLAPAETDGPLGHDQRAGALIAGDGLPFGVVVLAQPVGKVGRPQLA